ncbi:MAG: DUF4921 family protein [Spirochaetota bacterium]|nr:DUF4921 family protein [Spirochaetota bacterium]
MSHFHEFYHTMHDGTLKQINPFTRTEVWAVPGRSDKPIENVSLKEPVKINAKSKEDEDYCKFCTKKYFFTPPEKERVIFENNQFKTISIKSFEELEMSYAYFRRIANLFEIVTYNYWKENYNYKISDTLLQRKEEYFSTKNGIDHVLNIVDTKLKASGIDPIKVSEHEKLNEHANSFFAGCHELIIGSRHYKENAQFNHELCSSGEMTLEEHYQYINFTIRTMDNIFKNNRFVRYVTVFQNWLAPAGASFDHLHKQLVGLDEWGASIGKRINLVRENRNVFNELSVNFATYNDLIFAENDHAIAFADIGHRFPSIAIYSKSIQPYPTRQSEDEIRGMSSLVYACHKAMTSQVSCNEEWYYTPYDTIDVIPWHILLKWRINIPAGFEGGTDIYINPISPVQVRDKMVPKLYELRNQGLIGNIRIAEECHIPHNPLLYYRYKS